MFVNSTLNLGGRDSILCPSAQLNSVLITQKFISLYSQDPPITLIDHWCPTGRKHFMIATDTAER